MPEATQSFDWQGHRGARGLLPENTVPAFLHALDYPAIHTLELDVVISADRQVVVSHEPWMSPTICSDPAGLSLSEVETERVNLYRLNYDEIAGYDCGLRPHPAYPQQKKMAAAKPLLEQVITQADAYARQLDRPLPFYNIEIKSNPDWDDHYTPAPATFVKLVIGQVRRLGVADRVTIQSFDTRTLRELHRQAPDLILAYLIEHTDALSDNLAQLDFTPAIYSPYYKLVSARLVRSVHEHGMRIIPWTVNDPVVMQGLIDLGVDGIITDYPDRIPERSR